MILRPSMILKHDECPRAYKYQVVDKIRPAITSVNLPFGTTVHDACTEYVKAVAAGQSYDPVKAFEKDFERVLSSQALRYPAGYEPEDMLKMGSRLTDTFGETWEKTGLTPWVDTEGELVVERRLRAQIAPGVTLTGKPDIVAMDPEGTQAVPDVKTAGAVTSDAFLEASEQLTAYQLLLEDPQNQSLLGTTAVSRLGFLIARKGKVTARSRGPYWEGLRLGRRRTDDQVEEYRQKVVHVAKQIQSGYFPKRPRMAFNTPCGMCEYAGWCWRGDPTGLVFPDPEDLKPTEASTSNTDAYTSADAF